MSLLFITANLLGRALVSYALVWLVCWLWSRLNSRAAFRRSVRWPSLLAVVLLSLLGMLGAIARQGGIG